MRSSTTLSLSILILLALPSCVSSWPGLDDPTLTIAPEYTALRMKGKTRMESGIPPTRNSNLTVQDLGADGREDNIGIRLSYGNDTSGFDFHYNRFEAHSSGLGEARDAWGAIPAPSGSPLTPDEVDTRVTMDEFRARYIASFTMWEDEDLEDYWFTAGVGLQVGHKEMTFDVRGITSNTGQKILIKDDLSPMLAIRLQAQRGQLGVRLDAAINDDWSVGTGNLTGRFYDVSLVASYYLDAQDLTVFAGYRRFNITSRGNEAHLEFDTDFVLDGYLLGVQFIF